MSAISGEDFFTSFHKASHAINPSASEYEIADLGIERLNNIDTAYKAGRATYKAELLNPFQNYQPHIEVINEQLSKGQETTPKIGQAARGLTKFFREHNTNKHLVPGLIITETKQLLSKVKPFVSERRYNGLKSALAKADRAFMKHLSEIDAELAQESKTNTAALHSKLLNAIAYLEDYPGDSNMNERLEHYKEALNDLPLELPTLPERTQNVAQNTLFRPGFAIYGSMDSIPSD